MNTTILDWSVEFVVVLAFGLTSSDTCVWEGGRQL